MVDTSDVIIAVGHYAYNDGHNKGELLGVKENAWTDVGEYPFVMGI